MAQSRRIAVAVEFDQPYPNHVHIFQGIERYIAEQPEWTYVIDEHPFYKRRGRPEDYQHYDGVIARANHRLQRRLKKLGIPLVTVYLEDYRPGMPGVFTDHVAAGRLAGRHLTERGFRRLAFLGDLEFEAPRRLKQGFVRHCEELQLPCKVVAVEGVKFTDAETWLRLEKKITHFLSSLEPPIAIFVDDESITRLLVQTAVMRGLRVPQDLAVISYHEVSPIFLIRPQITSIEHNYDRVGYEAGRLLHKMMDGQAPPAEPIHIAPERINARESTDYFAVEDKLVAEALRFLSTRLHEKLRLEDLAYELSISRRSLQQRFKKALGVSVSDEIRRLRLEKAKRLLVDSDLRISRIPEQVGFATLDVMNKIFRRELGMTPGEYRKQELGGKE